jgi:hypothetical protein
MKLTKRESLFSAKESFAFGRENLLAGKKDVCFAISAGTGPISPADRDLPAEYHHHGRREASWIEVWISSDCSAREMTLNILVIHQQKTGSVCSGIRRFPSTSQKISLQAILRAGTLVDSQDQNCGRLWILFRGEETIEYDCSRARGTRQATVTRIQTGPCQKGGAYIRQEPFIRPSNLVTQAYQRLERK